MTCKNCENPLRTDYVYCPSCGAKITQVRLTFKGLFTDILERFFDFDNSFYRTVIQLTVRPELVIGSYVDGVRRRFLNPMTYLGFALGISGFLYFVMQKYGMDAIDLDILGTGTSSPVQEKVMDFTLEYNNFIYLTFIPLIAISGILSFNSRGYNLPEHLVSAIYTLAHLAIITFPFSLLVMLVIPEYYMGYSLFTFIIMFLYSAFVLIRLHPYSKGIVVVRTGLFLILFLVGYFAVSIGIHILLLLTGVLEFSDYLPPQA
jgi:hypothetical protein